MGTAFNYVWKRTVETYSRIGGLVLTAVALLLLPLTGQAQPDDAPRTAYLVRSVDALPVVLMSARTSLAPTDDEASFTAAAADVVVVGPAVKGLAAGSDHADAPNGFHELFQLQYEGYETVQL